MYRARLLLLLILFPSMKAMPNEDPFTTQVYKTIGNQELEVDIFTPSFTQKNDAPAPALMLIHGGGWVFGDRSEFHAVAEHYARLGLVTFCFEYRLSINPDGSFPRPGVSPIESVKDVRSGVRWIREHADTFRVNPDRIAVAGQSAGGQLALATELMEGIDETTDNLDISPEPQVIILLSSCVNTMEVWIDNLLADRRKEIWDISPFHRARPGMPPILAFHGDADTTVPFFTVRFFRKRMRELNNPFTLITLEGRDHYLGGDRDGKYAGYLDDMILLEMDSFLKQQGFIRK